jgi:hypothetical protein
MNLGMQDAFNLAWKIAATLRGWGPADLLDSYHAERHPLGAQALESTNAQLYLATAFSPEGQALRRLLEQTLEQEAGLNRRLAEQMSALSVRYGAGDPAAHPLIGSRLPDLDLSVRAFQLLARDSRPVLLDLTGGTLEHVAAGLRLLGVNTFTGILQDARRPDWAGVRAALVRPDGYVWWATNESDERETESALGSLIRGSLNRGHGSQW